MKRKSNCLATILFLIYLALMVWGLLVYSMAARLIGNRIKANRLFSILAGIVSVAVIGLLGFLLFANR